MTPGYRPGQHYEPGFAVAGFSADYILDLTERFINWQMIGAVFVLLVAWLFLSQWVRVTVFVVAILIWLNVLTLAGLASLYGQRASRPLRSLPLVAPPPQR
jgi:multidrug efflux pump subunit AcrB